MYTDLATYSRRAVADCLQAVRAFKFDLKEVDSIAGVDRVRALYDLCFQKTECVLFIPERDYYFMEFRKSVILHSPRKEREKALRWTGIYLTRELTGIISLMQAGEVNVID